MFALKQSRTWSLFSSSSPSVLHLRFRAVGSGPQEPLLCAACARPSAHAGLQIHLALRRNFFLFLVRVPGAGSSPLPKEPPWALAHFSTFSGISHPWEQAATKGQMVSNWSQCQRARLEDEETRWTVFRRRSVWQWWCWWKAQRPQLVLLDKIPT